MSDEKPVETLETIAEQIRDLARSVYELSDRVDGRFKGIDVRFDAVDQRFEELKAQLRTEIESVRGDVKLVAEGLAAQYSLNRRNEAEHEGFSERLNAHDARILVLEPKTPL
jgi:hypothetical protein